MGEAKSIKNMLACYGLELGHLVNFHKFSIMFIHNTPLLDCQIVRKVLGVNELEGGDKFLGLPTMVGSKNNRYSCLS